MSKSKKIPKTVQRIVDRLKGGQKLCRQRTPESGDIFYFFEPCGNVAGPATVERAIALGLIKPAGDALFAEADSQTWVAA